MIRVERFPVVVFHTVALGEGTKLVENLEYVVGVVEVMFVDILEV